MWYVRPAKPQISLRIRAVWSEPLLVAWVFYDCLATDWTPFGVSKLKRRLHRLVCVYTCRNATLLEVTCHDLFNFVESIWIGDGAPSTAVSSLLLILGGTSCNGRAQGSSPSYGTQSGRYMSTICRKCWKVLCLWLENRFKGTAWLILFSLIHWWKHCSYWTKNSLSLWTPHIGNVAVIAWLTIVSLVSLDVWAHLNCWQTERLTIIQNQGTRFELNNPQRLCFNP